ncbi:capsule biosynthesis protein CapA [Planococcus sp. CPCC 101016]|uniref:YveK family protein n=1 Tax=Planococcus sp. CPCC 101016 TaxID=2599617 RepID=UPI0011B72DDC|nr:Wzz/FepE/Etk N-terminal domain-containing protein [Planococcus sp. CPCC 101016]TWT07235.1 capsule biosynthesis protein CapA [Planococcus sp. CPCC 101016]
MNNKKAGQVLSINLKKRISYTVGLILFLMLAVWFVFVFIVSPKYQASSQLLIEETAQRSPHLTAEGNRIDSQTVAAYAAFIKSPEVLEQVRQNLGLQISISDLRKQMTVSSTNNSPVLTVIVSSDTSQQAVEIADETAFVFQNEVRNSLKADRVSIISPAALEDPVKKDLFFGLMMAAISGFILSIFTAIVINAAKTAANAKNREIRKKENQLQTVFK